MSWSSMLSGGVPGADTPSPLVPSFPERLSVAAHGGVANQYSKSHIKTQTVPVRGFWGHLLLNQLMSSGSIARRRCLCTLRPAFSVPFLRRGEMGSPRPKPRGWGAGGLCPPHGAGTPEEVLLPLGRAGSVRASRLLPVPPTGRRRANQPLPPLVI